MSMLQDLIRSRLRGGAGSQGQTRGVIWTEVDADGYPTKVDLTSIGDRNDYAMYSNNTGGIYRRVTEVTLPRDLTRMGIHMFRYCVALHQLDIPDTVQGKLDQTFVGSGIYELVFPAGINEFAGTCSICTSLRKATFKSKPAKGATNNTFQSCINLTEINVPWSEGEVANAPWSAPNATINYNYTPPEEE